MVNTSPTLATNFVFMNKTQLPILQYVYSQWSVYCWMRQAIRMFSDCQSKVIDLVSFHF